jgi:hypothetical protein
LSWHAIGAINTAIKNYLPVVKSIEAPYLPGPIELRETLTDLPHSPERTLMRSHY